MRQPHDMTSDALAELVTKIPCILYLDTDGQGRTFWNPDKQWQGADICDQLAQAMEQLGLMPRSPTCL